MAGTQEVDDVPGYYKALSDIYYGFMTYSKGTKDLSDFASYPAKFVRDVGEYGAVTRQDAVVVLSLAVLWTVLRYLCTWAIFTPVALKFKLYTANRKKFPESAWKSVFYSCTWSYSIYLLFICGKHDYFFRPTHIWEDWSARMPVPTDVYICYAVQLSFYLHSVYATLFMDAWRKDSIVMLFHHFLTMALIGFSYAARYHKIGLLVLFVHDVTDICLETTKCNVYFKNRGGKYYAIHDHISTIGFLCFASTWYVFRLYWYPLKVLYSTGYSSMTNGPKSGVEVPFYMFFNVMLWILQGLNVYWFLFILYFLYKVATGQMKEVDDIREDEVCEKYENLDSSDGNGVANGVDIPNGKRMKKE